MYSISVHNLDWNTADNDCSGHTGESGNTATDKVTGQEEGRTAMALCMSAAVTCFMGTAVLDEEEEGKEEEEEEQETLEGERVTSGKEEQVQS